MREAPTQNTEYRTQNTEHGTRNMKCYNLILEITFKSMLTLFGWYLLF